MDAPTLTMMMLAMLTGIMFGLMFGCAVGAYDTVCKSDLERSGYFVVHHEEVHGEFRTNWVEVIRK